MSGVNPVGKVFWSLRGTAVVVWFEVRSTTPLGTYSTPVGFYRHDKLPEVLVLRKSFS